MLKFHQHTINICDQIRDFDRLLTLIRHFLDIHDASRILIRFDDNSEGNLIVGTCRKFFADLGVKRASGKGFADEQVPVFLYVPAGKDGPKFLMTGNYLVLKGYNFSDSYAMSVGHLADRLKGAGEFVASWPRGTKFPNLVQREAIQTALNKLGLLSGTSDGRLGPITQQAYAKFQAAHGEVADGFIALSAYEELMAATK